jgi:2,4-dienoyl-CoA reductase-like NADH-dependent reductase (Old Yellow Enzyme family)
MTSSINEHSKLFQPVTLGALCLAHRVVLAPMTRNRGIPSSQHEGTYIACDLMREYYEQRTTAGGLVISEAIPVSMQVGSSNPNSCLANICNQGGDSPGVPGLYTDEQVESWKPVVKAVHDATNLQW